MLQENGIEVTQATVSRDIKELGLIKVPQAAGIVTDKPVGVSVVL